MNFRAQNSFRYFSEQERKLFKEVEGLIARQTRIKKQILDVPEVIQTPIVKKSKPLALQVHQNGSNTSKASNGLLQPSNFVLTLLFLEILRLF